MDRKHERDATGARDVKAEKESEATKDTFVSRKRKDDPKSRGQSVAKRLHPNIITPPPTNKRANDASTVMFTAGTKACIIDVVKNDTSTFVPNSQVLFIILNTMDNLMSENDIWLSISGGWTPLHSRIYFGTAFLIQTIRCMKEADMCTDTLKRVYDLVTELIPLENWTIPGPLVHIFKSITCFNPDIDKTRGDVTPALPETPELSTVPPYAYNRELMYLIPNIPAMFSRLLTVYNSRPDDGYTEEGLVDLASNVLVLHGELAQDQNPWQHTITSPGMNFAFKANVDLWEASWYQRASMNLPEEWNLHINRNTWHQFMRMNLATREHRWLTPMVKMMAAYANFFRGNHTLANCAPRNLAAGIVKCSISRDADLFYPRPFDPDLGISLIDEVSYVIKASHVDVNLQELNELYGVCSAINCHVRTRPPAAYRSGSFWTITPDAKEWNDNDVVTPALEIISEQLYRPEGQ